MWLSRIGSARPACLREQSVVWLVWGGAQYSFLMIEVVLVVRMRRCLEWAGLPTRWASLLRPRSTRLMAAAESSQARPFEAGFLLDQARQGRVVAELAAGVV